MNENNLLPKLLNEAHSHPEDEKVWMALALYYLENVDGRKELYYLRKAYETKATVETTTNLAHWLCYEYGEKDQALQLIKQALSLNPQSFYPYAAYAQILFTQPDYVDNPVRLSQETHHQIIFYSQKALEKLEHLSVDVQEQQSRHFIHLKNNIAVSKAILGELAESAQLFEQLEKHIAMACELPAINVCVEDIEYRLLLNRIYLALLRSDRSEAYQYLNEAEHHLNADDLDLASIYAYLGDSGQCLKFIDLNDPPHDSWQGIWHVIYAEYPQVWLNYIEKEIQQTKIYLHEAETNLKNAKTKEERRNFSEDVIYQQKELENFEKKLKQGKPASINTEDLRENLMYSWDCFLFGCARHGNLMADDQS